MTERHWPPITIASIAGPEPIAISTHEITITTGAILRSMYDETGNVWIIVADLDRRSTRTVIRFTLDEIWVTDAGDIIPIGPILHEWLTEQNDTTLELLGLEPPPDEARAHTKGNR